MNRLRLPCSMLGAAGIALCAVAAGPISAGDLPTVKVERIKPRSEKLQTLPFLRANKDFFRSRLDLLRQIVMPERQGEAVSLDPRHLRLRQLLEEIQASRDTVRIGRGRIERRKLMESVSAIAKLEGDLERMEEILAGQEARLSWLEEDFTGRQETALIVLVRGAPAQGTPETLVFCGEGEGTTRVALSEELWDSLRRGGMAKVFHSHIEPREHHFEIGFEGADWTIQAPYSITLEPERDRITFLELDLTEMELSHESVSLTTRAWVK